MAQGTEAQRQLFEYQQRIQHQERTIERIHVDFQHFQLLVQHAVAADGEGPQGLSSATPEAMLHRLRRLAAISLPSAERGAAAPPLEADEYEKTAGEQSGAER